MYGIPHGWGANLLMYNTDVVKPAPDSWSAVFDKDSPYKGKITAYDSPIYIADAALYLMAHQARPRHQEPLRPRPEAVRRRRRPAQGAEARTSASTGRDYTKEEQAFESRRHRLGTTWQVIANLARGRRRRRSTRCCPRRARPAGPTPGWSPPRPSTRTARTSGWTGSSRPKVNAAGRRVVRRGAGQPEGLRPRPRQEPLRRPTTPTDEAYADKIYYWTTPHEDASTAAAT